MKTSEKTAPSTRKMLTKLCAIVVSLAMVALLVPGCAPKVGTKPAEVAKQTYTPGTYTGTGNGNGGDITVEVTVSENAIENVEVVSQSETPIVAEKALEEIPQMVVDYQSLGIDTMTGATMSSFGILAAVEDALKQAGADTSALKEVPTTEQSTEHKDLEGDVIVIGGAAAGMSATLRLEELGKHVILVEKTYRLGGSISVSGGNQVVQGSKLQKECGVTDDSAESMIEDFQANGEDACVDHLITLYAENIGTTTDWLNETVGVQYDTETGLHDLAEYSHNRELAYKDGGAGATRTMKAALEETDAEILLDTAAEKLITEDGAVTGVEATAKDGTTYTIKADAVVMATGGYGNADQWLTEELQDSLYYGLMTSTGDGLDMATADDVNAATMNLQYAKLYPNGVETSGGRAKSTIDGNIKVWPMSTILVNAEGKRVVNEKASNHDILEVELEQTNSELFLLMDQENYDVWSATLPDTGFNAQAVEGYLEANGTSTPVFAHADTIEELAGIMDMDAKTLQATVDKYNAGVKAGKDEFGRSGEYLKQTIGDGPYYLVEQKPRYCTTMGGLVVNDSLQVENTDGEVIKGFYAAGEVVGGVMGTNSPSGANNGWALTSGKLAAEAIAGDK